MNKVIWYDRGWFPPYYGFCPNERAWKRAMVELKHPEKPYPNSDARCVSFQHKGNLVQIVCIGHHIDKKRDPPGVMALLVHEAMHVWRHIREDIGEKKPSAEFEAYALQNIATNLWRGYHETRGKLWR